MLTFKHRVKPIKTVFAYLLLILVTWSLIGCSDRLESKNLSNPQDSITTNQFNRLAEVAPPPLIQQLDSFLSRYQPQVSIISPLPDQLFTENKVEIKLALKDLPIFQDYQLNLGPYLQLILDNDTYLSIYDLDQPIILEDLTPGTHTIRVFAAKPWRESFKNEGAYTQAKFHIYTQTDNSPDTSLPLLTYNAPQGNYGAEPIMLDFYLTNAPLRFVARQNPEDAIGDWRIKVTINDESFLLDSWKPIYLTGFQPGTNWVKLEFLDGQGKRIDNLFNTKVALIDYQPKGQDSLSQLIRGELTADVAQSIVDPDYLVPSVPAIEITPDTPEVIETSPDSPEVIETTPDIPEISPDSPEVIETTPDIPEISPDSPEVIEITPDTPEISPDTSEVIEITPDTPEISPDSPEVIEITPDTEISEPETPKNYTIEDGEKPEWLKKVLDVVESIGG